MLYELFSRGDEMGKSMLQFAFIFQPLVQVKPFLSKLTKVREYFKVPADFVGVEGTHVSSDVQFIKHGNHDQKKKRIV